MITMKTNLTSTTSHGCGEATCFSPALTESTYAFLVRSEDKRGVTMEALVYALCVLCTVISLGHFASQPVATPATIQANTAARIALTSHATLVES